MMQQPYALACVPSDAGAQQSMSLATLYPTPHSPPPLIYGAPHAWPVPMMPAPVAPVSYLPPPLLAPDLMGHRMVVDNAPNFLPVFPPPASVFSAHTSPQPVDPLGRPATAPHTAASPLPVPQLGNNKSQPTSDSATSADDDPYHAQGTQLIVNYLAPCVDSRMLQQLFSPYGPMHGARVIYDKDCRRTKGFGFVYYHQADSARQAIQALNRKPWHGKVLKVEFVKNPIPLF